MGFSVTPNERIKHFSPCSLTKTRVITPVICDTPGTKPPGAAREDRTVEKPAGTGAPALSFFPAALSRGGWGQERKSGRHKAPRDYGTSLNLSDKGPATKKKRGNARRV